MTTDVVPLMQSQTWFVRVNPIKVDDFELETSFG